MVVVGNAQNMLTVCTASCTRATIERILLFLLFVHRAVERERSPTRQNKNLSLSALSTNAQNLGFSPFPDGFAVCSTSMLLDLLLNFVY